MSRKRVALIALIAAVAVVAAATVITALVVWNRGAKPVGTGRALPSATDEQLAAAAATTVFFGHQSVGENVVDGMSTLYAARGLDLPDIVSGTAPVDGDAAVFEHARIGTNGDPSGKIELFDSIIRDGVGDDVDVALMKLCYVDITSSTDVEALFDQYRDTMDRLQRDYPDVTFVHVTTPITTERSFTARAKSMIGREDNFSPENNVARERYNSLMRQEYGGSGLLFDLAAIQSTTAEGARLEGSVDGQVYYVMDPAYARDPGHLNEAGSMLAAEGLVAVIARTGDE